MITSICNKCGTEFTDNVGQLNNTIEKSFGYGSVYDCQSWSVYLCDDCLKLIVDSFVHKPKGYMEYEHDEYWDKLRIM